MLAIGQGYHICGDWCNPECIAPLIMYAAFAAYSVLVLTIILLVILSKDKLMKIELAYLVEEHGSRINLTLDDLSSGPFAILWTNNGHRGVITKEKVLNAINTLEDMAKHKGPDSVCGIQFFWDDFILTL